MSSTKSRKDTRAVVSLVARYRSPATFEYVQEACCDVSVGGMFIKSGNPAAAGTLLKLECEADASDKIRGVGRVVWLRREPNEHGPAGMGVKFVKLETGSKELISELVKRLAEAGIEARNISAPPEQIAAMRGAPKSSSGTTAAPVAAYSSIPTATQSAVAAAASAKSASSPLPTAAGASTKPASSSPLPSKASAAPTPAPVAGAVQPLPEASTPPADKPEIAAAVAASLMEATPAAAATIAKEASAPRSSGAAANAFDAEGETVAVAPAPSPSVPPEAPRRGGALRVWLGIAAGVAVLLAIIFADETPGSTSATSDQTATEPAPPAASAPTPPTAASEPAVTPTVSTPNDAPTPHNDAPPAATAPSEAPAAHTASSAPSEPAATATAADQKPRPPSHSESAPAPAAPTAADPKPHPAAHTEPPPAPATKAVPPAATAEPAKAGAKPYVIDFVTRPTGATVSIGELNVVAPGPLNLGPQMPDRVKVIAKKPGFQQSSAWIDHSGFETVNGTLWKRVYMTLPPDTSATPAPAPVPAHPR